MLWFDISWVSRCFKYGFIPFQSDLSCEIPSIQQWPGEVLAIGWASWAMSFSLDPGMEPHEDIGLMQHMHEQDITRLSNVAANLSSIYYYIDIDLDLLFMIFCPSFCSHAVREFLRSYQTRRVKHSSCFFQRKVQSTIACEHRHSTCQRVPKIHTLQIFAALGIFVTGPDAADAALLVWILRPLSFGHTLMNLMRVAAIFVLVGLVCGKFCWQGSVTQTINSLLDILGIDQRQSKCQCAKCLILTLFNNHQFCGVHRYPRLTTVAIVAVCVSSFRWRLSGCDLAKAWANACLQSHSEDAAPTLEVPRWAPGYRKHGRPNGSQRCSDFLDAS